MERLVDASSTLAISTNDISVQTNRTAYKNDLIYIILLSSNIKSYKVYLT